MAPKSQMPAKLAFDEFESVYAFAAVLRRLLALSGQDGGDKDAVVIEQILARIPAQLSQQVHLSFAGKELTVGNCTDAIREFLRAVPLVNNVGACGLLHFSQGVQWGTCTTSSSVLKIAQEGAAQPAGWHWVAYPLVAPSPAGPMTAVCVGFFAGAQERSVLPEWPKSSLFSMEIA